MKPIHDKVNKIINVASFASHEVFHLILNLEVPMTSSEYECKHVSSQLTLASIGMYQ